MEATAVSVGKAVLDGALGYAKSKTAEEIALQLGVERDVGFITDELQMMQSFLEMADEDNGQNKVFMAWVNQIRDLAYKVEDSLMDFGLHKEKKPFWGCIPRSLSDRRRIAKEVKELRAKVEDVSNRNLRYHLVKGDKGSTRPTAAEKQANVASAAMIGINESTVTLEQEKSEVTLYQLITSEEEDLRVIAIWGTSGDHGKTSAIQEVYYDPKVLKKFGFCAWVRLMYPFNPQVFLRSLVRQFYENSHDEVGKQESETSVGANVLAKMEKMDQTDLIRVFNAQLCRSSYLIVINDLSTIEERQCIKMYFPNNKKQSRIIVLTQSVETASLCIEKPYQVSELRQLSFDQTIYLLHVKNTEEHSMTSEARHTGMEEKLKVWKDNTKKTDFVPAMMEQARIILKKCDGLPLAISTIGGYLATKPKTAIEWRKMNDRISAQLEINPELRTIKTVLMRSYDGLPYYLKSAFLYLSIFQEDQKVRLARLVRRWTAEGYSQDRHGITAEQLGHRYFGELLDRSMILPGGDVKRYNGKINSCQLHDMIREICILKVREENLVFTLEDGCCLSSTQGPIRHLVIGSNWKRDGDALPSVLDLSHVRSLTVFGEWRPFFISENMRFLRVLDLEDTTKLRDHHLDRVVKLHHLKYLSLRGCFNIFCLPNSLGNLRHLQTLDVRGTRIFELPTTITNLGKLQNLCAPDFFRRTRNVRGEDDIHNESPFTGGLNRRDVLNLFRYKLKGIALVGAKVPRGIGQLKALHTLGGANVSWDKGNATVKEFRELTELCKLGVVGISSKNRKEFWSAIAGHYHLRSLSVRGNPMDGMLESKEHDDLDGCLGEGLSPPSWLESLKLYGKLVRVTDWIHRLQNLCKLVLQSSRLEQDDAIQALGVLPNLAVLHLKSDSFRAKRFRFQNSAFPSLVVLVLYNLYSLESVLFEEDAMPRLELLQIDYCNMLKKISGLSVLTSLKEIRVNVYGFPGLLKEQVRSQLGEDQKHVIVKF